ncbi:MAG: 3'-5' exonuclease [Chitinophagaceae bacterium]|nr:MAG: 3'-5' exonuclease [Chitinophagaceae bacterium]
MMQLKKPLVIFDLETTGLNVITDRIIEACFIKVHPNDSKEVKNYILNPEMPIPAESSAIHGFYDKDVADKPTFKQIASELNKWLEGCDLGGYNCNRFDVPVLVEEFYRTGSTFKLENRKIVDVQKIFHLMEPRNLSAAYKFYCGRDLEDAHSAEADTIATYEILLSQLKKYDKDIKSDVSFLHEFTKDGEFVDTGRRMVFNKDKKEVFNFGKHRGKLVEKVLQDEPQYYDWIMKSEFSAHTKQKLTEIKLRQNS